MIHHKSCSVIEFIEGAYFKRVSALAVTLKRFELIRAYTMFTSELLQIPDNEIVP